MRNIIDRQKDILAIISNLDISPTMYRNAVAKYKAITAFLCDCGIEADMYPQGSFAFGTVVRPIGTKSSANYDLDVICQVIGNKSEYSPRELRQKIETALTSSSVYEGKLQVYDECFTVEYADINGISFTIDIVPATDETCDTKERLKKKSPLPELIDTAIAIPKHNDEQNFTWLTNNPKGFKTWFDKINEPFLVYTRAGYRQLLFENNRALFSSVEEIPHELERSAVQRVIQILKYHRNVFYSKIEDGDNIMPISAIINAVVAQISSQHTPNCTIFELLEFVLNELGIYAQQQRLTLNEFAQVYGRRNVFTRPDGKWYISNPANPEDNLANKWNEDARIPRFFFRWVSVVKSDLITELQQADDQDFGTILENGFGRTTVLSVLGKKYSAISLPKPIIAQAAAKPYHTNDI